MVTILLTRHGHVEGIAPPRFRGRADLSLTERGRSQAEALGHRIASDWRPTRIYSSPAKRCLATAAAISRHGGPAASVLDDLNDIDYGAWQSKSYDEVEQSHPQLFRAWFATPQLVRFPDGESLQDLLARTADVLRLVAALPGEETVVLVGHDSVNRALMTQLLDQPQSAFWRIDQQPCCINEFTIDHGRVRAIRINDTGHLSATARG